MRKLSFGILVFAAVIVFTSAIPLDNGNGPDGHSIGLKPAEKNRLGRKPPGKVPGPKLIQEPQVTASFKAQEFEKDQFGNVALEEMNKNAYVLLSDDDNNNKKGKKHDLAFLSSDHKKDDKKKDLLDP